MKQRGNDINYIEDYEELSESDRIKDKSKLNQAIRARTLRKDSVKDEAGKRETGNWFQKYSAEAQKLQERDEYQEASTGAGKMLDQFI